MKNWLEETWNLLVQAAVWLCAFIGSMLLPPVTGLVESEQNPAARVSRFTIFIVAILVGVSFVVSRTLNKKKHVWIWIVLTAVFFCSTLYFVNRNYQLNNLLTCTCADKAVVRGNQYKDPDVIKLFYPQGVDCSILCTRFVNTEKKVVPEKVWTESSLNESRSILFLSYVICFPFAALTIISIVQAIYCSTGRK